MKKPAYDFYEKKIRKETAEHFRKLCEMEEAETPKEQETLRINTDYTPECIDRRIRATSRYLSKAEECFKIFMPFAKAKAPLMHPPPSPLLYPQFSEAVRPNLGNPMGLRPVDNLWISCVHRWISPASPM